MATRRYYRHRFTLTVLSDDTHPNLNNLSMADLSYETDEGDMVLHSVETSSDELTREQMENALVDAGSDPDFFSR
jgi:hypothetical protein